MEVLWAILDLVTLWDSWLYEPQPTLRSLPGGKLIRVPSSAITSVN